MSEKVQSERSAVNTLVSLRKVESALQGLTEWSNSKVSVGHELICLRGFSALLTGCMLPKFDGPPSCVPDRDWGAIAVLLESVVDNLEPAIERAAAGIVEELKEEGQSDA